MRRRLLVPLAFLFFLGFPAVGLVWIWNDAHARLRKSAEPEARLLLEKALSATKAEDFDVLGTTTFSKAGGAAATLKRIHDLGAFRSLEDLKYVRSYAGSRNDMVWQFVEFRTTAKFERGGDVPVKVTVGRHSINVVWLIEKISLPD